MALLPPYTVNQVDMVNELSIRKNVIAERDDLMESYGRREMDLMDFRMSYAFKLEVSVVVDIGIGAKQSHTFDVIYSVRMKHNLAS